jgi:hypothetical protein
MRSSIAYHHAWCSKAREEHSPCMFGVSSSAWHCLYPLGYVVDGNQDVLTVLGLLERSHDVSAPHIKYFYSKVVVEGHCIASYDVYLKLALLTTPDEFLGVLIQHRLDSEESTLLDFGLCAEYSVVASVWCRVTFLDDLQSFCRQYTPSQQVVRAYPVKIWVIPKVTSAFDLKFSPILPRWYIAYNHKVHDVCIPWVGVCHLRQHVVA